METKITVELIDNFNVIVFWQIGDLKYKLQHMYYGKPILIEEVEESFQHLKELAEQANIEFAIVIYEPFKIKPHRETWLSRLYGRLFKNGDEKIVAVE